MKIKNKRQMYELQSRWRLGNCLETWRTIPEVRKSSYEGPISIRGLIPGLGMRSHIAKPDLEKATQKYCRERGCVPSQLMYSEMAAPSMGIKRLFNAEIARLPSGLYVTWSDKNIHMKEAMRTPRIAKNLQAKFLLEQVLDPSDYDDLQILLDEFQDAVVELSTVQRRVGWAKRRAIFWEVRHY